jgi:hypothetical protein
MIGSVEQFSEIGVMAFSIERLGDLARHLVVL